MGVGRVITPQQAQDMLHYESADGSTAPDLCLTAELAAHAPVMAEQIANMHYEYAVQVKGGWWVDENDAGKLVPTTDPMRALRHYHPDVASQLAEEAGKQLEHECCVVRRLATDWEVVE